MNRKDTKKSRKSEVGSRKLEVGRPKSAAHFNNLKQLRIGMIPIICINLWTR